MPGGTCSELTRVGRGRRSAVGGGCSVAATKSPAPNRVEDGASSIREDGGTPTNLVSIWPGDAGKSLPRKRKPEGYTKVDYAAIRTAWRCPLTSYDLRRVPKRIVRAGVDIIAHGGPDNAPWSGIQDI